METQHRVEAVESGDHIQMLVGGDVPEPICAQAVGMYPARQAIDLGMHAAHRRRCFTAPQRFCENRIEEGLFGVLVGQDRRFQQVVRLAQSRQ